jgi:hypothetical protein
MEIDETVHMGEQQVVVEKTKVEKVIDVLNGALTSKEKFPINVDGTWEMLGYARKGHFVDFLKDTLKPGVICIYIYIRVGSENSEPTYV